MKRAHDVAREHLQGQQRRQKASYDRNLKEQQFDRGDMVYKLDTTTKIGITSKLKPVYEGPYLVTEVLSPILFRIAGRKSSHVIHHDRLRICTDRVIPMWMRRKRHKFLEETSRDDHTGLLDAADILADSAPLFTEHQNPKTIPSITRKSSERNIASGIDVSPRRSKFGREVKRPSYLRSYLSD